MKAWLRPAPIIVTVVVIALVGVGIFGLLHKEKSNTTEPTSKQKTEQTKKFDSSFDQVNKTALDKGQTDGYLRNRVAFLAQYQANKDFTEGDKIVAEIETNVSEDKMDAQSFQAIALYEQAKGDKEKYKHYLGLLAQRYETEGKTEMAAAVKKLIAQQ